MCSNDKIWKKNCIMHFIFRIEQCLAQYVLHYRIIGIIQSSIVCSNCKGLATYCMILQELCSDDASFLQKRQCCTKCTCLCKWISDQRNKLPRGKNSGCSGRMTKTMCTQRFEGARFFFSGK